MPDLGFQSAQVSGAPLPTCQLQTAIWSGHAGTYQTTVVSQLG